MASDNDFEWDWLKHENSIIHNRGNMFIVAESIFIAALASLSKSSIIPDSILCICGFIITVIWLLVNIKHVYGAHRVLDLRLRENDKRYLNILSDISNVMVFGYFNIKWSNHFILWIIIPIFFLIVWIYLLYLQI